MRNADGILLASPTYFADITTEIKALIDRAGMVARANDHMLRRKAGAGIIAVRRGGAIHAFDSLNHFFLISQMIVPGSIYWNLGIGREIGEVEQDAEAFAAVMQAFKLPKETPERAAQIEAAIQAQAPMQTPRASAMAGAIGTVVIVAGVIALR